MDSKKNSVYLLFRKPGRFFSIERVFHQLMPILGKELSVHEWTAPHANASPKDLLGNLRSAAKCKADVYHVTGDVHYVVRALPRRRTLLTIHDCVFLHRTKGLKRRILKWLFLDMPVRHCRLVTTISEATKQDILKHTQCSPEKITVIPNPVTDNIYYQPREITWDTPRILFIGATPNKNLERAIDALATVPCQLDIIGKPGPEITERLSRYAITHTIQSGLSDEDIAKMYAEADLILFPSLFEGFGLPIVEGQKAGRPVITSDLSPMKEVAGGAACLINREKLVSDGFKNVERFSTAAIARQYEECYRKILTDQ
jgi:glycosyltransferase involved in cell wall biosynthesis